MPSLSAALVAPMDARAAQAAILSTKSTPDWDWLRACEALVNDAKAGAAEVPFLLQSFVRNYPVDAKSRRLGGESFMHEESLDLHNAC